MPTASGDRVRPSTALALGAIARVEAAVWSPAPAAEFAVDGRMLRRRPPSPGVELDRLADVNARRALRADALTITANSRSSAIVVGKYVRDRHVKARAYLEAADRPATLKAWVAEAGPASLGADELSARRRLARIPEFRAPEVLRSGRLDGINYIVEAVAYGRHPLTPETRLEAAVDITASLAVAYGRYGVRHRRLRKLVNREFNDRLKAVLHSPGVQWQSEWGRPGELLRRLNLISSRNQRLACSLCHGDLVFTNIIRTDDARHVLTDWEYCRVRPIAFDLGKMLLASGDPPRVLAATEAGLADLLKARRGYQLREQLALGLCQVLSWTPERRERALAAGRLQFFESEQTQRLRWLSQLLDD